MSVNEMSLELDSGTRASFLSNRKLGVLAMLGAPMLLVESVLRTANVLPQDGDNFWVGLLEMIYVGGWIALAFGMRRLRATGDGKASRVLFIVQIVGLILAFLFAVQICFGASFAKPNSFFVVTDLAFPFSHLFMFVVGAFVARAKVWRGLPNA